MRALLAGLALAAAALAAGVAWQDTHVRLDRRGRPSDQRVVAHDESPYTSMTWVASNAANYFQLRFFDRIEGGVALRPSWADVITLAADDARLAHLVPADRARPEADRPDPGTVNSSAYFSLFPAGILLHGKGDAARDKPWRVLMIGLGAGAGVAHLAHHFPEIAITVVDIDDKVIDLVRDNYPLLAWLASQRRTDGEPRLRFLGRDARQFVRGERRTGRRYDLIVLDAFTAGATIPPHLLTREFFAECGDILGDGGLVIANVIGSYGSVSPPRLGRKRLVVGGALRSLRASGLPHAWSVPVFSDLDHPANFQRTKERNFLLLAARHAIDPERGAHAWERIRAWTPYPELPSQRWLARTDALVDATGKVLTTLVDATQMDAEVPRLARALRELWLPPELPRYFRRHATHDSGLVQGVARIGGLQPRGLGWNSSDAAAVVRTTTDAVLLPREVWRVSMSFAHRADLHDPDVLVGPVDGPQRPDRATWAIPDAPLFTDQMPNADILNH